MRHTVAALLKLLTLNGNTIYLFTYPTSDQEIYRMVLETGLSEEAAKHLSSIQSAAVVKVEYQERQDRNMLLEKGIGTHGRFAEIWISEGWKYRLATNEHMRAHIPEYKRKGPT